MPFLQDGAATGEIGSALPPARLIVDPDKLLILKRGFEDECDRVNKWIYDNGGYLRVVSPPGADPCSEGTAAALGRNGTAAIEAANGYLLQLRMVAEALGEIARDYGLTEDGNTTKFTPGPR
ncbi:MAG TPA: hypothetical protein VGX25_28640 [Actinophytocola sp.]|uniref:hypothetical protein n=1 Tax=Actinophytocola sp. TaxID=1872138 RepID=UPI002DDD5DCE|nr:hypothetical protein [Actinophytocola sp.]HEV2783370.1 hypothetical protein [Actinophytocola sp.]